MQKAFNRGPCFKLGQHWRMAHARNGGGSHAWSTALHPSDRGLIDNIRQFAMNQQQGSGATEPTERGP